MFRPATVREIRGSKLLVEVDRAAACAGCGLCAAARRGALLIEVDGREADVSSAGGEVMLSMPAADLLLASALVFLAPLACFGAGLALMHNLRGGHAGWSAAGGFFGLAAGFMAAWLIERRLRRRGHFQIKAVGRCSA